MAFYYDYSTMVGWQGPLTGIPRTVFYLAQAMSMLVKDFRLVAINDTLQAFHHVKMDEQGIRIREKVVFFSGDILFSSGANWAFSCYNTEIQRLKAHDVYFIQLFYDRIPQLFPYFYPQGIGYGDYIAQWTNETLALCDYSFAISECTKKDIISRSRQHGIDIAGMKVVRLGDNITTHLSGNLAYSRYSAEDRFILSVGTLEIRKNQVMLLQAYRLLNERYPGQLPTLLLVGRKGWLDGEIAFQVANDRVLAELVDIISDASDVELNWLYGNCMFTLFPSYYEGWGLPVAESLRHGKPCISSNTSSMVEIAPELTLFASPYSAESWVKQIEHLLFSPGALAMQAEKVRREYAPVSWHETAMAIRNVIIDGCVK